MGWTSEGLQPLRLTGTLLAARPPSMPLSQEQTQELHSVVEHRRAVLRAEIDRGLGKVRADRLEDLAGASPDPGDESVASLISDLDQADTSRDLSELRSLDAAHERIADGSYGTCIECGRDIGYARLKGLVERHDTPETAHEAILEAFDRHLGGAALRDDFSLVVVGRMTPPPLPNLPRVPPPPPPPRRS